MKLTMTKPRVSTVTKRFDDYYDESEEEIDDLLSKLDLAKECAAKAATDLANAKEASLGLDSGLYDHMEAAEYRAAADEAVAKEASVKPEGNLLSKLHSHFASIASPFTPQDSLALAKVSMDVTPRTGMEGHANGMHSDSFHPIDEAMTFGDTPKTSERTGPLASFNTSPLLKGHTVNFESTSPFRYDDDKSGYPDFNLGTHSVTYNMAPAPVTHQAHSSVPSSATHQAHSAYAQNTSSVPSTAINQAHPSVLPTVTQQATTSVPYPIRSTNVQNSATYQVHPVTHQVHPVHHQVHPAYVNPVHVHVPSQAYANNPVTTTALPSQNGHQYIRQVAGISYRNHIRMISDHLDHI
jgi:hypothetical protein